MNNSSHQNARRGVARRRNENNRPILALVVALALVAGGAGGESAAAEPAPFSPASAVVRLFNGRDLSNWTTWLVDSRGDDPRGVFQVQDGMIRISGDGFGYLGADRAYRDYRLTAEFKWGRRNWQTRQGMARDSGIFLHSVGPDGNSFDGGGAFKAAIECQIMEGSVGDLLLIKGRDFQGKTVPVRALLEAEDQRDAEGWPTWRRGGERVLLDGGGRINWFGKDRNWRDTFGFRGAGDLEKPAGQWNRVECECRRRGVRIWVNGVLANEALDVFPSSGKILLQCEGAEIFFRNVELHPLKVGE